MAHGTDIFPFDAHTNVAACMVLGECFTGLPTFFLVFLSPGMVGFIDLSLLD
jgi:hypothetical protein